MARENILVTGGAGYIGSHIVRDLYEKGYNPIVYDNLSTGRRENILYGQLIEGNINNDTLVTQTIQEYQIRDVIHFAASIVVEESVSRPLEYYENNSANTFRLVQTCIRNRIENFVFSSTAAVYGIPIKIPVPETAHMLPINPYGKSKVMTEMLLEDVSAAYPHFHYIALRYFNVAGADAQVRIGQNYKKPTHLMTLALRTALGDYPGLKIYGSDYDTPDGTAVRDYIHIDDLAHAHLLALEYLKSEKKSRVFNCGYGTGRSVFEVVNTTKEITGCDFQTFLCGRRQGDPPALVADSRLIQAELGWKPKFNDLPYIIKTAWEWEKKIKKERIIKEE
ncbi:MAG: UDP-glucose 4-epimerase GalE [Acidobacteria bacterium]|jgi:UDP-glucose 4-epimerase|nr:UDP-glucose 4-epimerase GalE [Acidobacteriota bacterium]